MHYQTVPISEFLEGLFSVLLPEAFHFLLCVQARRGFFLLLLLCWRVVCDSACSSSLVGSISRKRQVSNFNEGKGTIRMYMRIDSIATYTLFFVQRFVSNSSNAARSGAVLVRLFLHEPILLS
jgi:hypothetical protein